MVRIYYIQDPTTKHDNIMRHDKKEIEMRGIGELTACFDLNGFVF